MGNKSHNAVRSISGAGEHNPAEGTKEKRLRLTQAEQEEYAKLRERTISTIIEIYEYQGKIPELSENPTSAELENRRKAIAKIDYLEAMEKAAEYAEKRPNSAAGQWIKISADDTEKEGAMSEGAYRKTRGEIETINFENDWKAMGGAGINKRSRKRHS